jgi:hypothetical protein
MRFPLYQGLSKSPFLLRHVVSFLDAYLSGAAPFLSQRFNHPITCECQVRELAGCSTKWFSSGKNRSSEGTPRRCRPAEGQKGRTWRTQSLYDQPSNSGTEEGGRQETGRGVCVGGCMDTCRAVKVLMPSVSTTR